MNITKQISRDEQETLYLIEAIPLCDNIINIYIPVVHNN